MKNKAYIIIIVLTIFCVLGFSYMSSNNKSLTLSATADTSERTKYENAVVETAYQYFYRGRALQYGGIIMNYETEENRKYTSNSIIQKQFATTNYKSTGMNPDAMYSPEEATDQDYHFFVCSHFTFGVYAETFAFKNGDKYQITSKDGNVKYGTSQLNSIGNKDSNNYRKDITVISVRDTSSYKIKKHADDVYNKISSVVRPGDIFVYGYGDNGGGHAMLYIGDDKILHSSGHAPNAYSSIGPLVNDYGVSSAKYHLEAKADIIDTESGTLEVSTDQFGTIKSSSFSKALKGYINKDVEDKVLTILRPINEVVNNSNIVLSKNAEKRLKKPGLSLTKKASVEKYQSVNLGGSIKYTITIENKSTKNYTNISVYDEIPTYTTLKSLSESCKNTDNKINCSVNVNAGQKATVYFTVTVKKNMNYLGKKIVSDQGKVNGIPLKKITTTINRTLTSTERSNISEYAKAAEGKTYSNSEAFISDMYKKLNYNLDILSANKVFNNLFSTGTYKLTKNDGTFKSRTLHKSGDVLKTFELLKKSNVNSEYKDYMNSYVEGLFGGVATTSQDETGSSHSRNVVFTTKTLLAGDVLYVYDANYANDAISKKGGYIVGEKNAYLYLGSGEFATIKSGKVYIYNSKNNFNYYFYTPDRSKEYKVDYTGIRKVSIGERLLTSLIGQDSFIVLRPSYNIDIKLTAIEVTTMPTKTKYIQNKEKIVLTGGKLKLTYGSYGTKTINLDSKGVTVTNFDNSKVGETSATINYQGKKTTIKVNVVSKSLTSISLKTKPEKTSYVRNSEQLDLTGGIILAKYDDGSSSEIGMTSDSVTVTGFDNSKLGKVKLTVDYLGKTTSFEVNIVSASVESISIASKPSKLSYLEGKESLDLTGGVINVKYNDGTTKKVTLPNKEVTVKGFDNKTVGSKKITLTYNNKTTTFKVSIIPKSVESISMNSLPNKLDYIENTEKLDISSGSIKVKYDNDTYDIVNLNSPNVSVSGFDNSTVGTNTINVIYQEKTTTFNVNIISKAKREIVSIEIKEKPTKTNYTQNEEKLDLTGGKILVKYNDGTSETISMKSSNITTSGFNNTNVGNNKVTLNYLGKTATFEVSIKRRSVKEVSIIEEPQKTTYEENEKLDLSGGSIEVKYSDNTKENIPLDSPNVVVKENNNEETSTIEVEYYGAKDSFEVKTSKTLGLFDEYLEPDDDFDIDYSEYGEFFDAVKMKPNEVIMSILVILGLSIIVYFVTRKR